MFTFTAYVQQKSQSERPRSRPVRETKFGRFAGARFLFDFLIRNDPLGDISASGKPGADLGRFSDLPDQARRDGPTTMNVVNVDDVQSHDDLRDHCR